MDKTALLNQINHLYRIAGKLVAVLLVILISIFILKPIIVKPIMFQLVGLLFFLIFSILISYVYFATKSLGDENKYSEEPIVFTRAQKELANISIYSFVIFIMAIAILVVFNN